MPTLTEKISTMRLERKSIDQTVRTVLDFPTRLQYDCMTPICKMAFLPAKIVHTNEFYLHQGVQGKVGDTVAENEGKWHSYSEVAEILMNRAADIDSRIEILKRGGENEMHLNHVSFADETPMKAFVAPLSHSVKEIAAKTAPVISRTDENLNGNNYESDFDDENLMHPTGLDGIFEIREFLDNDGNEVKNEVVNLQQEMENIEKKIGSLSASDGSAAPSSSVGSDKLRAFAASLSQMSSNASKGELSEPNEQPYHKRDVDCTNSSNRRDGSNSGLEAFDRLEDLEKEEEEWLNESKAADRIRMRERELQRNVLPEASAKGWKKGFFSKSPCSTSKPAYSIASATPSLGKSVVKFSSSADDADVQEQIGTPLIQHSLPHNIPVVSHSTLQGKDPKEYYKEQRKPLVGLQKKQRQSGVKEIPNTFSDTKGSSGGILKKPAAVSKAFTGNVMERFP